MELDIVRGHAVAFIEERVMLIGCVAAGRQ
jgi:hypothetical protein